MKQVATVTPVRGCSVGDLRAIAREAEAAGFWGIFSPELPPFSALANSQVFAEVTSEITVGTWITNIYMRHPVMCAGEALTVQEVSNGRMLLGLGVSHKPFNERLGIDMGDPLEEMRKYVAAVRSFMSGDSPLLNIKRELPGVPIYIAGLTEKAAELAGEAADGFIPNLVTPGHMKKLIDAVKRGAEKSGRSPRGIKITNGVYSFISDDLDEARTAATLALTGYARLPFYQRLFCNAGFEDVIGSIRSGVEPAAAFTGEFLDAMALIGPPGRCREGLERHREAGVDIPVIVPYPVGSESNVDVIRKALKTFRV